MVVGILVPFSISIALPENRNDVEILEGQSICLSISTDLKW